MYRYIPLKLDLPLNIRVSNLQSEQSPEGLCHGQVSPLLAGLLSHSPQCHNGLAPSSSWHKCLCRSMPRGDSWSGKWEGCRYLCPKLPASKTLSQSRLWHRAVQDPCADTSSVPRWWLLPQQQRWYCYLGVLWTAGSKSSHHSGNAVDDHCCPHSLVNLRSVSVDLIMWSLSIAILSEFGLSLFSCDHTFAHPFNEAVSLRIIFMCSWRKGWCLQRADCAYINLRRGHGFLYFKTNGLCRGLGHPSFSIWSKKIQISCGWVKFM